MKVLLFDAYAGGHHYEFASGLRETLAERAPDVDVDVLFAAPTDAEEMFFDDGDVDHLYDDSPFPEPPGFLPDRDPLPAAARFLGRQVSDPCWRIVRDLLSYAADREYDVVHCLELDKLHAYLWAQYGDDAPPLVGSINGIFYKPVDSPLPPVAPLRRVLAAGAGKPFVRFAPPVAHRGIAWNRWFLARCLDDGVVDHLTVPTEEARDDVRSTVSGAHDDRLSVVPDPTTSWSDGGDAADGGDATDGDAADRNGADGDAPDEETDEQTAARRRLDLPESEPQLLFFGRLCEENGIRTLFRALERYDGPECTVAFAGQPVAVSPSDVERVARRSAATVVSRLEFVPQSEVETYFRAADGVLLPYERSFGACRPSNVFQKACMAGRPVIASDFGVLGRRVREWDLGLLCDPGSAESLTEAIRTFVERDGGVHDPKSMAAFAETQTFDRLGETVLDAYRRLADGRSGPDLSGGDGRG